MAKIPGFGSFTTRTAFVRKGLSMGMSANEIQKALKGTPFKARRSVILREVDLYVTAQTQAAYIERQTPTRKIDIQRHTYRKYGQEANFNYEVKISFWNERIPSMAGWSEFTTTLASNDQLSLDEVRSRLMEWLESKYGAHSISAIEMELQGAYLKP